MFRISFLLVRFCIDSGSLFCILYVVEWKPKVINLGDNKNALCQLVWQEHFKCFHGGQ